MATQAGPEKEVTLGDGPLAGQTVTIREGQPAATFRHGDDQRATYILSPVTGDYEYLP